MLLNPLAEAILNALAFNALAHYSPRCKVGEHVYESASLRILYLLARRDTRMEYLWAASGVYRIYHAFKYRAEALSTSRPGRTRTTKNASEGGETGFDPSRRP